MRQSYFLVAILIYLAPAASAGCSAKAVAPEFYPTTLVTEAQQNPERSDTPADLRTAAECADLDGDGTSESIVAHYSNAVSGRVVVIQKSDESWHVVAEAEVPAQAEPMVKILDLDDDAKPEIVAITRWRAGVEEYTIFRWNGNELRDITPPTAADTSRDEDLGTATFLDLDADGHLECVVFHNCVTPPCPKDVFALNASGHYTYQRSPVYLRFFERTEGKPRVEESEFDVRDPHGAYDLLIAPDGKGKALAVSSATIKLNGTVIARPDDFSKAVSVLRIENVPVLPQNELQIELRGEPGSKLTVMIAPRS